MLGLFLIKLQARLPIVLSMKKLIVLLLASLTTMTSFAAEPCGKEGSIEERIKSCNSAKGDFVLVLRDEKGLEIYKDTKTDFLWGDRISTDFNNYGSQKACHEDLPEALLLKEVSWRIPTVREFEVAATHGMKEALPSTDRSYWTSTPVRSSWKQKRRRGFTNQTYIWNAVDNKTDYGDLKDAASVRCIGKAPKSK